MAKHDSKSDAAINKSAKVERYCRGGYCPNGGTKKPAPQLIIKGYWFGVARFFNWPASNGEY